MNAKTTKMDEKKFHINSLLVRRRINAALKFVLAADSCFVKVFISADSCNEFSNTYKLVKCKCKCKCKCMCKKIPYRIRFGLILQRRIISLSSPKYNFSSNHYLTLLASESALGNRCGKRTSGARNHRFFYLD